MLIIVAYKLCVLKGELDMKKIAMIMTILVVDLFNTNFIQRWNDKLRPVNLTELDYC